MHPFMRTLLTRVCKRRMAKAKMRKALMNRIRLRLPTATVIKNLPRKRRKTLKKTTLLKRLVLRPVTLLRRKFLTGSPRLKERKN